MKEKVSALLDGALDDEASSRMLESLKRDGALRRDWENFCLIGDVLREEQGLSPDFARNVMRCIEDEPAIVAPHRREVGSGLVRHLMPIAASVMGVAAVGWVAVTLNSDGPAVERIAAAKVQQPVALVSGPVEAPARVSGNTAESSEREYLFAHQAMAPSAAMPGVALYVRTVSDSRAAGQR